MFGSIVLWTCNTEPQRYVKNLCVKRLQVTASTLFVLKNPDDLQLEPGKAKAAAEILHAGRHAPKLPES